MLCSQKLTNTIGAPVVVRNIAYNEVNKKLYGINNAGRLFVWNLERPKFNWGNRLNESKEIEISLESDKKYYKGNETALIRVVLSRPKDEIKSFYIFRYKPSSLNTETEWDVQFLLHDRNWTDEISSFEGNNRFDEFENIINIGFKDTLDEYGQYDYFVLSSKQNINFDSKIDFRNKIIKLINEESNGVYCNKTSIIVPKLKAEKEYVLDNLPQLKINQEYKIFFSNLKNELCLQVDEEVYLYKNLDSKVYMNYSQGIIMTKDVENNLSVNINFTDGTSYQCEVNYE